MEQYNHIEIKRVEKAQDYRFRSNPNAPRPPERDVANHSIKLKNQLKSSSCKILDKRKEANIDSEKLMVLELNSIALSPDKLEQMLLKFNMSLVEEVKIPKNEAVRLLVQFDDLDDIEAFDKERSLWKNDSRETKVLTMPQRRDIFKSIDNIRNLSPEERTGVRLKKYLAKTKSSTSYFIVNIDIWFNGKEQSAIEIESQIKRALGTEGSKLLEDLLETPSMLLGRALVNEFTVKVLLNLDIIAMVELPCDKVILNPHDFYKDDGKYIIKNRLDNNAPLAAVLDSGVFAANPLLENIIVESEDFDLTEKTTTDLNGHGTGVAGIVVYGDLESSRESKVFEPLVRICNGKIMHNDGGNASFSINKRPEIMVEEAIKYFHENSKCRVFNLSVGDPDYVYNGGRQFPWAELLDKLSLELDVVIVISAGNVAEPCLEGFNTRDQLIQQCGNQLFKPEHRLIAPATVALGITVGSIARSAEPSQQMGITNVSSGDKDCVSVFTRIGSGVNGAIKPDVVDYGGNFCVTQAPRGTSRWNKNNLGLLETTLANNNKTFKKSCGTSFAAPRATHIIARIERALEKQLDEKPSANLIRAMFINSARHTPNMIKSSEDFIDPEHTGKNNPKQDRKLRLYGFGKANDSLLYSAFNRVSLFAEDSLPLRSYHLYKIPVPKEFTLIKANKEIAISLAYNPPARLSRKAYLTNNLWFEVFRRLDEDTLNSYKVRANSEEGVATVLSRMPGNYIASGFKPGCTTIKNGTLQQRVWQKGPGGGGDLQWDEDKAGADKPYIFVLVAGKENFKYLEQEIPQDYALVVTFSYESQEDIQLYNTLKNRVDLKVRAPIRTTVRIKS